MLPCFHEAEAIDLRRIGLAFRLWGVRPGRVLESALAMGMLLLFTAGAHGNESASPPRKSWPLWGAGLISSSVEPGVAAAQEVGTRTYGLYTFASFLVYETLSLGGDIAWEIFGGSVPEDRYRPTIWRVSVAAGLRTPSVPFGRGSNAVRFALGVNVGRNLFGLSEEDVRLNDRHYYEPFIVFHRGKGGFGVGVSYRIYPSADSDIRNAFVLRLGVP